MSPGTERKLARRRHGIASLSQACGLALAIAIATSHGAVPVELRNEALVTESCGSGLHTAQAGPEARGCCVLITSDGPRCATASRGYCEMRAREAGVLFEFHEAASCGDLAQCR
jgi:hypothetical protein